jgi:hypothetical protein
MPPNGIRDKIVFERSHNLLPRKDLRWPKKSRCNTPRPEKAFSRHFAAGKERPASRTERLRAKRFDSDQLCGYFAAINCLREERVPASDYPDDANGRCLRSMEASGADMSAQYEVDFEHVFPDRAAAERFARLTKKHGKVELSEYDGDSSFYWQVRVVVALIPTYADISRVEQELDAIAGSCNGRADGWGILHGPD